LLPAPCGSRPGVESGETRFRSLQPPPSTSFRSRWPAFPCEMTTAIFCARACLRHLIGAPGPMSRIFRYSSRDAILFHPSLDRKRFFFFRPALAPQQESTSHLPDPSTNNILLPTPPRNHPQYHTPTQAPNPTSGPSRPLSRLILSSLASSRHTSALLPMVESGGDGGEALGSMSPVPSKRCFSPCMIFAQELVLPHLAFPPTQATKPFPLTQ